MGACQSGPLTAVKYRDHTRDVFMLSTKCGADMVDSGKRDRDDQPILKPGCILDYNKNKTGVDTSDQLASYHPFERRTVKWYKKLFFRFLSLVEVNRYLLYKKITAAQAPDQRKPLDHEAFTRQLVKDLLAGTQHGTTTKPRGRPSTQLAPERLVPADHQHFPALIPATPSRCGPLRQCVVCKTIEVRKMSRYLCTTCQVCLCVVPCFQLYHTQRDIKAARRQVQPTVCEQ